KNADPVLDEEAAGVIHFDHRPGTADGLETHTAEHRSRPDHYALSDYASFEHSGVRLNLGCRADSDIPFRNPRGWMYPGRGIDDGREVFPVEAAPRQFVVKSGEVCARF